MDAATAEAVAAICREAAKAGRDMGEALHAAGLLLTPALRAQIKAEAYRHLANEVLAWSPAEFLRRTNRTLTNATPTEMYHAIVEWIQEHVGQILKEG